MISTKKKNGLKIVAIGGGTGLFTLLSGLKDYTKNITAIVTTADDGGSSGILRDELGLLPPGDIRRCLIALAEEKELIYKLFKYRFDKGNLAGHSLGNLLIAALTDIKKGSFKKAINEISKVFAIKGKVLPATPQQVTLYAILKDGRVIKDQASIAGYKKYSHIIDIKALKGRAPIEGVFLKPKSPRPLKDSLKAIASTDLITIGPGSLYTSIIPNLLVKGIARAIKKSPAIKVYICNIMTQIGETEGYTASQHIKAIEQYLGKDIFDYVILNIGSAPQKILKRYKKERKELVEPDIKKAHYKLIKKNLIRKKVFVRHDSKKLARTIIKLTNKTDKVKRKV